MVEQYDGPNSMSLHFTELDVELRNLLLPHHVHKGIQCANAHRRLTLDRRQGLPVVFAKCSECQDNFKLYENADYPAGYIHDDVTRLLERITCDCGGTVFEVGVGYEYPGDPVSSEDISWFEVVGRCTECGELHKLFSDETA